MLNSHNIYITTPIFYINDKPHIGHAYSTFTADVLARFYRLLGYDTYFVTGTDENSQKTIEAAKKKLDILKKIGKNSEEIEKNLLNYKQSKIVDKDIEKLFFYIKNKGPIELLDKYLSGKIENIPLKLVQIYTDYMADIWKKTWENLKISFDDFIRTTEERHKKAVEKFYLKAQQNGYIYKGKYKGLYCWKCEAFYKESDLLRTTELIDKDKLNHNYSYELLSNKSSDKLLLCPIHKYPVEEIEEENYFFKLTVFKKQLEEYLNQSHIFPKFRRKELINNFLKEGLEDFSISREGKKWGIPFPDDKNHVFYVWYDALTNYLSVLGYAKEDQDNNCGAKSKNLFKKFRIDGKIIHIIGKDIIKFHAIYWPAMLLASGEKLPDFIAAHGFFTINGEKISKSLGNAISPTNLTKKYGIDVVRYYLFKDIKFGSDSDFNINTLQNIYNANLLGGWGNLVSRVTKLALKYNINQISKDELFGIKHYLKIQFENYIFSESNKLKKLIVNGYDQNVILDYITNFKFQEYLNHWYELIQFSNKLIDNEKPWEKIKVKKTLDRGKMILKVLLFFIRQLAILSAPILIESFEKIKEILGEEKLSQIDTTNKIKNIKDIFDIEKIEFQLKPGYLYKKLN